STVNIGITSCFQDKEVKFLRRAEDNRLHAEKLAEDERCVMLSAKNPLSEKDVLTKKDLKKLTLAYYSDLTDDISESYRKYFNPDRCFRLNSRESILQLVAEDGAVGVFPDRATRNSQFMRNGLVKSVPMEGVDTKISYYLLYPEPKTMSVNEIRLLEIIREKFPDIMKYKIE
ncbi:MAG: substrate-binding domain-containing protein, partial [Peptococcaceae bacterium]